MLSSETDVIMERRKLPEMAGAELWVVERWMCVLDFITSLRNTGQNLQFVIKTMPFIFRQCWSTHCCGRWTCHLTKTLCSLFYYL